MFDLSCNGIKLLLCNFLMSLLWFRSFSLFLVFVLLANNLLALLLLLDTQPFTLSIFSLQTESLLPFMCSIKRFRDSCAFLFSSFQSTGEFSIPSSTIESNFTV
eukprot:NODE_286_length_11757_cov_0.187768.p11 type:complete len:104 gc:universal NODE_286_length_11757_cov_0.187768:4367-4056(-)